MCVNPIWIRTLDSSFVIKCLGSSNFDVTMTLVVKNGVIGVAYFKSDVAATDVDDDVH